VLFNHTFKKSKIFSLTFLSHTPKIVKSLVYSFYFVQSGYHTDKGEKKSSALYDFRVFYWLPRPDFDRNLIILQPFQITRIFL
jgi:hypothetical protein